MPFQHCDICGKEIDLDEDVEHFELNEQGETLCEEDARENPVWLLDK